MLESCDRPMTRQPSLPVLINAKIHEEIDTTTGQDHRVKESKYSYHVLIDYGDIANGFEKNASMYFRNYDDCVMAMHNYLFRKVYDFQNIEQEIYSGPLSE